MSRCGYCGCVRETGHHGAHVVFSDTWAKRLDELDACQAGLARLALSWPSGEAESWVTTLKEEKGEPE